MAIKAESSPCSQGSFKMWTGWLDHMEQCYGSTTLAYTEISQQVLDGISGNVMVLRGWIHSFNFPQAPQQCSHLCFGFSWQHLETLYKNIYRPQRLNLTHQSPLAPQAKLKQTFQVKCLISSVDMCWIALKCADIVFQRIYPKFQCICYQLNSTVLR